MRIKDSIQRLGWRFRESAKKNKPFTPNEKDLEAFNAVVEFYEKQTIDNYNHNELMFKMYIWHRVEMMKHYNEDVFDTISQKKLTETLCKPVEVFLNRLTEYLNEREYKVLTNDLSSTTKPYFTLSEKEKNKMAEKLQVMLKEKPELFKSLTGDVWSEEDVKDNIIAEFNQLLLIA